MIIFIHGLSGEIWCWSLLELKKYENKMKIRAGAKGNQEQNDDEEKYPSQDKLCSKGELFTRA